MRVLVNVDWVQAHLDAIVPIDVLCGVNEPETRDVGLPNARVINLDVEGSDHTSGLSHTMLQPAAFQTVLQEMGINPGDQLVIYDGHGIFSAPRVWWMLKSVGIDAKILNGGLPAWQAAGHEVVDHQPVVEPGTIVVRNEVVGFTDLQGVQQALAQPEISVLDARSRGRFIGEEAEPRPGLASGHMAGAINTPFMRFVDNGRITPDTIRAFVAQIGDPSAIVTSCGSGVTACVLALLAYEAGFEDIQVYDGSWAEWGQDPSRVVTGE